MTTHCRFPGTRIALLLGVLVLGAAPLAMSAQTSDVPPPTQAGPPPGGPGRGHHMEEHRIEMMTRELNLSSDQVTKLKSIMDDSHQQMIALHEDTSTSQDAKHARMESIHKNEKAQIKSMLNTDQNAKFEAMEARMRERREEHREGGAQPQEAPPAPQS